jgi:hypothetical protein
VRTATSATGWGHGRLRGAVAAAVLLALCASPPASSGTAATSADGILAVSSLSFAGASVTSVLLQSSEPVAKASVVVPQGYALDLGLAAGTSLGSVTVLVGDAAGGFEDFAAGELVVENPAKYASDATAQACAPGAHAAAWRSSLQAPGRTLELTIFVDPAGAAESPGSAFVLTFCPVWPSSSVGVAHLIANGLILSFEDGLDAPTASGRYTWSGLITPAGPGSLGAEPSRTFELRSVLALPRTLTLRATHDARTKSVVLSGRLLALGQPEAGVEIAFSEFVVAADDFDFFGPVRTNAAGEFSFRRRVTGTTEYLASVRSEPVPCTAPSSAPGGCVSELVAPPLPAQAAVVIRKRTDPKLVLRRADSAAARNANLKAGDFPPGWTTVPLLTPLELCPRVAPNLSRLTATGEARSPIFTTQTTVAASSSTVYSSVAQARTAFARTATPAIVECLAEDAREEEGAGAVLTAGRLSFPPVGDQTRAFRLVVADDQGSAYIDLVSFRRGRTVVQLLFSAVGGPVGEAQSLAARVAARTRRS